MSCPDFIHLHRNDALRQPHETVSLKHFHGPVYLVADPGPRGKTLGAVLSFGREAWQAYDERGQLLAGALETRERAIEWVAER